MHGGSERERRLPLNLRSLNRADEHRAALFGGGRSCSFGVKRGRCSFDVKRTKNMGVSIPPCPLNDLAGAIIATGVRCRQGSGFILQLFRSAPRDVIVPCAAKCVICMKCEQRVFAPAAL